MGVIRVIRKSNSGSTRIVDTVYFTVNDTKSLASAVLLKNYYWERDEDNVKSIENRMRMIGFSRTYLNKVKAETGDLCCAYCPKTGLIIEEDKMKVPNHIKATIDHIVPISKGGGLFDYENLTVACGKCNSSKGSLSVEEFTKRKNHGNVKTTS